MKKIFAILNIIILFFPVISNGQDPGDLDETYGSLGKAYIDYNYTNEFGMAAAVDTNEGTIIAAYKRNENLYDIIITRVKKNGFIDSDWGTDYDGFTLINTSEFEQPEDIIIHFNERIIIGGWMKDMESGVYKGLLIMLYPSGNPDITFGTDGIVQFEYSGNVYFKAVEIQPATGDDLILTAGIYNNAEADQGCIVSFRPDGTLNELFGDGGIVVTDFPSGAAYNDLVVQPDLKIVATGYTIESDGTKSILISRYNPDGSIDETFGDSGHATTKIFDSDYGVSVVLQDDLKIIAGGTSEYEVAGSIQRYFTLVRRNTDGSIDDTYGLLPHGYMAYGTSTEGNYFSSLVIQPDNKTILGGTSDHEETNDFVVIRTKTNGFPDADDFGTNGWVFADMAGSEDGLNDLVFQEDNKLMAVGYSYHPTFDDFDISVARYLTGIPTSIGKHGKSCISLEVFPNPVASGYFNVQYFIANNEEIDISLKNLLGQKMLIFDKSTKTKGSYTQAFKLPANISKGIYFLDFQTSHSRETVKIIIK